MNIVMMFPLLERVVYERFHHGLDYRIFDGNNGRGSVRVEIWADGQKLGAGIGSNKSQARRKAAFLALKQMELDLGSRFSIEKPRS